jgi:RNA-binding protein PNO1
MEAEKLIESPEVREDKKEQKKGGFEMHSVMIPPNRMTPIKNNWEKICETVVKNMKLQIRMNMKKKTVDIRECEDTEDRAAIQRTFNFLKAFMLGFGLEDAIAMLRLDDLFLDTFQIKDVKNLQGDHLSRCIARISGEKGKTKHAIENATKTRIILADSTIHLMGSYANMRSARDSLCSLIMGTPPGKVYSQLKYVSRRLNEKF